jgi:hypothetical protein
MMRKRNMAAREVIGLCRQERFCRQESVSKRLFDERLGGET